MKKTEIQALVKSALLEKASALLDGATQVGSSKYVMPFEVDGAVIYGEVSFAVKNWVTTEKTNAFDLDEAVSEYEAKLLEAEEKAKAKAAERAEKEAAKKAKAMAKDAVEDAVEDAE